MKCGLTVYKAEGLRGLYVGSMSALMVNCAENSVLFGMRTSTTAFTGMDYYGIILTKTSLARSSMVNFVLFVKWGVVRRFYPFICK